MLSRRLLVVLIIFILLGGIGIASGQIFVVRHIEPVLVGLPEYIVNDARFYSDIKNSLGFTQGRSILFSLDRDRVWNTVENVDYRVRVTNVEALFPNRIRITMRERYPVFRFDYNGQQMVLDSELRFVTTADVLTDERLVDITGQITYLRDRRVNGQIPLGTFMHEFFTPTTDEEALTNLEREQLTRIERLRDLSELFFWNEDIFEDSLRHLFEDFSFHGTNLMLQFRDDTPLNRIRIMDFTDGDLLIQKIQLIWDVRTLVTHQYHEYIVEVVSGDIRVIGPDGPLADRPIGGG